jgi:hypothetical protein
MTVEVHIARPVLGTFLERALQQQLRAACFPAFGGFWVDHLGVVPGTAQFSPGPGGVDVKVRVDAFIAADAAVLATPNASPPTITVPGTLTVRMTTTGTVASLQVVDADVVGNPLPGLDPLRTALVQRLSTPITTDLTQSLGAPPRDAPPAGAGTESPVYVDLPGLVETLAVPGFEDAPVAIAVLEDGTQLVLNRAADGSTRVAGTYSGTFPRVQVDGDWAVTTARGRFTVLRRNSGGAIGQ